MAARVCPKCGSPRTRSVGLSASHYYRCDACEYLFRDERQERDGHPAVPASSACVECGSERTRIIGQSGTPPLVHRRCEDCGHVSSRPLDD